jgi:FkbM family methyltransferase
VLVEGHPTTFGRLVTVRPASLSLGVAVCAKHGTVAFARHADSTSGIVEEMSSSFRMRWRHSRANTICVPCGPLRDWLALLRLERVDYVSLDVENAELLALSTIDWTRLSVGVLIAECSQVGCTGVNDRKVAETLVARGLRHVANLRVRHDLWDAVFGNASWELA